MRDRLFEDSKAGVDRSDESNNKAEFGSSMSLLKDGNQKEHEAECSNEGGVSRPIADHFTDCTVLFAGKYRRTCYVVQRNWSCNSHDPRYSIKRRHCGLYSLELST